MIPFAETPQGKGLLRQIRAAAAVRSSWKFFELQAVYKKAQAFYESNAAMPGQHDDDHQPTEKEIDMSLEQKIEELTQAVTALIAAMKSGGAAASSADASTEKVAGKPAADKPAADKPAAGTKTKVVVKKQEHTREELVALLTEVKEKFDSDAARACFAPTEKMKDIPESDIDKVYEAAKAKMEEEADDGDI